MKTAFLILGAQRSGTSVTSHLLSKFGINFGDEKRFLQDKHNPTFFELKWVNQYNDRLIRSLGYQYTDFFLPIETDYDNTDTLEIATQLPDLLHQEWQDEPTIGIKDPRISLTFPIWQRALLAKGYSLKIILVFRRPADFLRSNQKLFHNWAGWDDRKHLRFWLQLNLSAIYFARNYPVYLVSYEDVMEQPQVVAKRFADCFNLDKNRVEVAVSVVDPAYHHHNRSTQTGYPEIDNYYDRLAAHNLSAADYLSYRHHALNGAA
ncbi:MAG: hypothetical protein Kow00121_15540 [Elainellaceae cyanobacterium]